MTEKRTQPRFSVSLPVEIKLYHVEGQADLAGRTQTATLADVSEGGMRIVVDRPLTLAAQVELRLSIPVLASSFTHRAEVRWSRNLDGTGRYATGLQFHGTPAYMQEWRELMEYVRES